jgi:hypothetical protein
MAISEAKRKADKKWHDANYKQVKLSMPNAEAEALNDYCTSNNLTSKAGFIRRLIAGAIKAPISDWDRIELYCLENNTKPVEMLLDYINTH